MDDMAVTTIGSSNDTVFVFKIGLLRATTRVFGNLAPWFSRSMPIVYSCIRLMIETLLKASIQ